MTLKDIDKLLTGLQLLPLEEITDHADEWREDITKAIAVLREGERLADDDPLWTKAPGVRRSREELDGLLESIIQSW
tara:strand:- start:217 stop:447 length:231 start_codon:yes stop_codon:yes gene_type:complete